MPTSLEKYLLQTADKLIFYSTYEDETRTIALPSELEEFYKEVTDEQYEWIEERNGRSFYCNYGSHYGYIHLLGNWSDSEIDEIFNRITKKEPNDEKEFSMMPGDNCVKDNVCLRCRNIGLVWGVRKSGNIVNGICLDCKEYDKLLLI